MKTICKLLACSLILLLILSGCSGVSEIFYRSDAVKAKVVEPLPQKTEADCLWNATTEENTYSDNSAAVVGTVRNIREVCVEYTNKYGKEKEQYITLFDLEVDRTVYNYGESFPDMITVGHMWSSRAYPRGIPELEEGKTFLLFGCRPSELPSDSLELSNYVDLWIVNTYRLMIETTDRGYLTSVDFFLNEIDSECKDKVSASMSDIAEILASRSAPDSAEYASDLSSGFCVDEDALESVIQQQAQRHN